MQTQVHGVLKRGVYKPVRKYSSRTMAALATFVMSGLLHEYVLLLFSLPSSANPGEESEKSKSYIDYAPLYGNQFCFFAWNGMLMALEYCFVVGLKNSHGVRMSVLSRMASTVKASPAVVKSMMIILLALPVSHWFTDEYVLSGLFSHYAIGFPVITKL